MVIAADLGPEGPESLGRRFGASRRYDALVNNATVARDWSTIDSDNDEMLEQLEKCATSHECGGIT